MHFEHLDQLKWLLPLAIATATVVFWFLNFRSRRGLRNAYANEKHLLRTARRLHLTTFSELIKLLGYNLVAVLLAFSLAWMTSTTSFDSPGVGDLRLLGAFDVSGSMRADPYRQIMPTRTGAPPVGQHGTNLEMALNIHFNQVVKAAGRNQFALITYNTESEEKTPFCEDVGAVSWLLRTKKLIGIGQAPGNGSDYNAGLAGAAREITIDYDAGKRYFVVLYSDGGWKGDAVARQKAIDNLKALKVHLIVVGLGSRTPDKIPIYLQERLIDYAPYGREPKDSAFLDEAALLDLVKAYGADAEYVPMDPGSSKSLDEKWWRSKFSLKQQEEAPEPLFEYFLLPAVLVWCLLLARGKFSRTDSNNSRDQGRSSFSGLRTKR